MLPVDIPLVPIGCEKIVYAKDQPEYIPLPVIRRPDGVVYSEWEPTLEEVQRLCCGERVRLWVWTFNTPLQPVSLEVTGDLDREIAPTTPPEVN